MTKRNRIEETTNRDIHQKIAEKLLVSDDARSIILQVILDKFAIFQEDQANFKENNLRTKVNQSTGKSEKKKAPPNPSTVATTPDSILYCLVKLISNEKKLNKVLETQSKETFYSRMCNTLMLLTQFRYELIYSKRPVVGSILPFPISMFVYEEPKQGIFSDISLDTLSLIAEVSARFFQEIPYMLRPGQNFDIRDIQNYIKGLNNILQVKKDNLLKKGEPFPEELEEKLKVLQMYIKTLKTNTHFLAGEKEPLDLTFIDPNPVLEFLAGLAREKELTNFPELILVVESLNRPKNLQPEEQDEDFEDAV